MDFAEDIPVLLADFGEDFPVKLNGVLIATFKGIFNHEVIIDSPNVAEIGSSVLTLLLDASNYATLDKSKKYTFGYKDTAYLQRGPAIDGAGFKKLQLTKA